MIDKIIYENFLKKFVMENSTVFISTLAISLALTGIDIFILNKVKAHTFQLINSTKYSEKSSLFYFLALMSVINVFTYSLGILYSYLKNNVTFKWRSFISNNIFMNTIKQYSSSYKDIKTAEYINTINSVQSSTNTLIQNLIPSFITDTIVVLSITGYLLYFDIFIGSLLILYIFFSVFIMYFYNDTIKTLLATRTNIYYDILNNTTDSLSNLSQIFINNKEDFEIDKQKDTTLAFNESAYNVENMYFIIISCLYVVCMILITYIFYVLYVKHINKQLKNEDFIYMIMTLYMFVGTMLSISYNTLSLHSISSELKRCEPFIQELYENSKDELDKNGNKRKYVNNVNFLGDIKFKNVTFKYENIFVYNKTNFTIHGKKTTAILGPSGSGKSTICKILLKLYLPQDGTIYIDNVDYLNIDTKMLRNNINYINQYTVLFDKTILENIQYGNEHLTKEQVEEFINKNKLNKIFENIDKGIYANTGVNGGKLSMGMQKCVILLRGLLKQEYKILILDEPLTSLDGDHKKIIVDLIQKISHNKTVIIITHDTDILHICDHVINIEDIKNSSKPNLSESLESLGKMESLENFQNLYDKNSIHSSFNPVISIKDYLLNLITL
jgi:ABC-type bacteriocin/lantibiotic exporter with double-glycine peptidase domain